MSIAAPWTTDILGSEWAARAIPLGVDDEGPVTATLIRRAAGPRHTRAVLYIHGFVDYFFQEHQAEHFENLGYDFYAVDLRKYGRSLHEGQTPNYIDNLAEYRHELDSAARIIKREGHDELLVLGHSTGGLIAALWANARTNTPVTGVPHISALILNSPWFDLNKPWFHRTLATRALNQLAKITPHTVIGSLKPYYGKALHKDTGGEWDYDLALKPHNGFPIRAGWFAAIRRGHQRIKNGLHIDCPVLVLASRRSGSAETHHDRLTTTDSVLNVRHIELGAHKLGKDVTFVPIARGAHDLSLSPEPARTAYFDAIDAWLTGLEDH
ncbi:alpha/beta hydrolase [Timonella sp. A28]|uniref:alpha/beta hydrolase n=1 Tax=Timonella sp. A28 TaxID=3442640 RepID=UPI003EBB0D82